MHSELICSWNFANCCCCAVHVVQPASDSPGAEVQLLLRLQSDSQLSTVWNTGKSQTVSDSQTVSQTSQSDCQLTISRTISQSVRKTFCQTVSQRSQTDIKSVIKSNIQSDSRALPSTHSGTHLQDLGNFLSICFFFYQRPGSCSWFPNLLWTRIQGTVPESWFIAYSGTRDRNLVLHFEKSGKQTNQICHKKVQFSSGT